MNEFETVEQEVVQQEQPQPEVVEDIVAEPSIEQQQEAVAPKESFKELRTKFEREKEARERAERERNEFQSILKSLELEALRYQQQQYNQQQNQKPKEEEVDINSFDDDDLVDGKALKKILKREQQERENLKKQIMQQENDRRKFDVTSRLKSRYADWDSVVTPENVKMLEETRPALAKSLSMLGDIEEMGAETYQVIKDFGIYKPQQNFPEKEAIQRNMAKPRSIQSLSPQTGSSPMSQANAFANGMTDELKAKLYAEMLEKSKGY